MTPAQKSFFDNHPNAEVLHFAADGTPFFEEHNAQTHASGLTDKEIKTITRHELVDDEIQHEITEEDLENNPELRGQVEVGETVTLSGVVDADSEDAPNTDTNQETPMSKPKGRTKKE